MLLRTEVASECPYCLLPLMYISLNALVPVFNKPHYLFNCIEEWVLPEQDIDAAYLFEDMGDLDDDLSSLLVPDLDFSSIVANPMPAVPKMPQPVQTGALPDSFGLVLIRDISLFGALLWWHTVPSMVGSWVHAVLLWSHK